MSDRLTRPENPSLTQTPRHQIADVIPLEHETSILDWLERSGRLLDRTNVEEDPVDPEEEIAELIENDNKYDDDDEESQI
jgi:hypothetical protein